MYGSTVSIIWISDRHILTVLCAAYQSALLSTPLVLIRLLALFAGFWSFIQLLLTLALIACCLGMAYVECSYAQE